MYHASELFIIKDVLDKYTQQKQNNECMLSTTGLKSKPADVSWSKDKKVTELLPCIIAMYDCRQLDDVSIVENVHMVTEILYQIFIRCCHLHLPSLSSFCHMHLVHLSPRDHFIWLHDKPNIYVSWSTSELRVRLAPLNRFKPSSKIFYWPFQGGTSFVDLLCFCSVLCLLCLCASVYMCFVVTCWERADLLALVCGVFCEFVTFPLVSWVRCGTWLYRFLIFAPLLTFISYVHM